MTRPQSVRKVNKAVIAWVMGLPAVTVKMRAKTTSTHENIKQKKAATAMPGATAGIKKRTKKPVRLWPSKKAISSKDLGMAAIKLSKIHMAIGRLKTQCTSAMPMGELTSPARANKIKIGS